MRKNMLLVLRVFWAQTEVELQLLFVLKIRVGGSLWLLFVTLLINEYLLDSSIV